MKCDLTPDPKPVIDPNDPDPGRRAVEALAALGLVELAAAVLTVADSGNPSGGEGGGNQPLVTCRFPHGLIPGDRVTLAGVEPYDGTYVVEPAGDEAFLLDDVSYTVGASDGTWRRA